MGFVILCDEIIKIFVILCDFFSFSSLFRKRIKLLNYLILFQELLFYMRKKLIFFFSVFISFQKVY